MSERVPNDEQRDRCLDELMSAYASGQIESAEFAARSDRVLNGSSLADLDAALSGLVLHNPPEPTNPALSFPPPHEMPSPSESLRLHGARATRRHAIVLGGSVAFTLAAGAAIFVAAVKPNQQQVISSPPQSSDPASTAAYPPPEVYPVPEGFLSVDGYLGYYQYTRSEIGRVIITNDMATLIVKSGGESWQQVIITKEGQTRIDPAEPVANTFSIYEAEVSILVEVAQSSSHILGEQIEAVEFVRPDQNQRVWMIARSTTGSEVVWDAYTRIVVSVNNRAVGAVLAPEPQSPSPTPTR